MEDNVVGIIQARTKSTRLPNKTLINICGKPILEHIVNRANRCNLFNKLVVATTDCSSDDMIVSLCDQLGISTYRGSETDVLDRYYQCAKIHKAEVVVRITADNPFYDPEIAHLIISELLKEDFDYVSNTIHPTYPEGLNVEVFTVDALERAWCEATTALDREHVTSYIWLRPNQFRLKNVEYEKNLSQLRLTMDTPEDLSLVKAVYEKLYKPGKIFLMNDILSLFQNYPEIQQFNSKVERFSSHKKIIQETK